MKKYTISILMISCLSACGQKSQSYNNEILNHRAAYKREFITDKRSPLTIEDTALLRFFPANKAFVVNAELELTPDSVPFDMPTVSGKTKRYRQFGILHFTINDTVQHLKVLQSLKLITKREYKDHLFVPFTDATTYLDTYGGGRYLDLSQADIENGTIELDFNKCYNPWCAYADGYSCPIPPPENRLDVAIKAGEMKYAGQSNH